MSTLPGQAFNPPDPVQIARHLTVIAEKSQSVVLAFLQHQVSEGVLDLENSAQLGRAFLELYQRLLADPVGLARRQLQWWQDGLRLWQCSALAAWGQDLEPLVAPELDDRRFLDDDWRDHWLFDFIKQAYLLTARGYLALVADVQGIDAKTQHKLEFYSRQFVDALAPTNFALTNPEVIRATLESGGENLLRGLENLLTDLERGRGQLRIQMSDPAAFELGVNVATTPGKVIYQNELMQLIQYAPATPAVYRRPLLMVPPWINKFYVLDLRPKNSFVQWWLEQGFTVFMISWINPDRSLAERNFEDYLQWGPLAALDAIERAVGERQVNAVGYCLGGTLLGCTAAWLAARGEERLQSCTFFTTLFDFSRPGDLAVFIDEEQLCNLEKRMQARGYLEGGEMATTFSMLRANDLIWSFFINNYLLGRDPVPFDLLHWNADSTRMPACMHSFYLRNFYQHNRLAQPGGITLLGVPIDIRLVKVPSYFLAAIEDHIAPWKSVYVAARMVSGPVHFVLSGSGHIAGVINPPAKHKYGYWLNPQTAATAEAWLGGAVRHEGSWWVDWADWVRQYGGESVPARIPGSGRLPVIEEAPGSYVRMQADGREIL